MSAAGTAILVIDDEQDMRDMLAFELSQEGFEVETAGSGVAALEAIRRRKFDLAVTDLKMPGMDGVQTVAALKKIDPDIEIIVATGYATVETAVACIRNGAYDYIRKPYELRDLLQLLSRALERSSLQGSVALFEASRVLLGTLRQADLVRAVIAPATRILGADGVALVLDERVEAAVEPAMRGGSVPPAPSLIAYLAGRAAEADRPLRIPGPDEGLPAELREAGYASALCYRLVSRELPLGALLLLRRAGAIDFAGSELQRGSVFASQVAMALDNARLYSALDERLRELLATRDRLVRSEKLAVASKLAGGVAHEINNPLAAVSANLGALRQYADTVRTVWTAIQGVQGYLRQLDDLSARAHCRALDAATGGQVQSELVMEDIGAVIDETLEAARRIGELVAGFTHMAASDPAQPLSPLDLAEALRECVAAASGSSKGERATLVCVAPSGLLALAAAADLKLALTNLIGFALQQELAQAGSLAGRVEVDLLVDGEQPCVRIRMPHLSTTAAERAELFDPRIDVRADGGTTLRLDIRLPIAHQLLDRTGGTVAVEEGGEGGLQFRVLLQPAPPGEEEPSALAVPVGAREVGRA